jgi:hypothetical protein
LHFKRQREEALDWFRAREREQAETLDAKHRAEHARMEAQRAQGAREEWLQSWEKYALQSLPYQVPPEVRLEVHEAVRRRLAELNPLPARDVTQRLVDAVTESAVCSWRRNQEIEGVLTEARDQMLPSAARRRFTWDDLTPWQIRAVRVAAGVIEELRDDVPIEEMCAAAKQAVASVTAEYEAQQAAEADAELRRSVISSIWLPAELSDHGRILATQAITTALEQLPQGTPRAALREAADRALEPFQKAIAEARAVQRAEQEAEERRRRDQSTRETVLRRLEWKFPYDLAEPDREQGRTAARQAIDALPADTSERDQDAARDRAVEPFLKAHERRKLVEPLIEAGLREILPYVRQLEAEWEFDTDAQTLEAELKPLVRTRIEKRLTGKESREDVAKKVRRLVREELEIGTET